MKMQNSGIKTFLSRWLVMLALAAGLTGLTAFAVRWLYGAWIPWSWALCVFGVFAAMGTLLSLWSWWEEWQWE